MNQMFEGIVDSKTDIHAMSATAIQGIRSAAQERGLLSRDEAEFLFTIDRCGFVGGADWFPFAVKAVADFIVWECRPTGHVTEADADWLIGLVGDQPTAFGRAVLFAVVREAEASPSRLSELVMRAAVGRCLLV
ncbi:MAG: hypothetical protein ACRCWF_11250 [Beijerinckiaceae bacterium]